MVKTKTSRIELRTDETTKKLIEKAASITGSTVSAYILSKSLSSAQKDVDELESLVIRKEDNEKFYSLISDPPEPNIDLIKLMNSDSDK